MNLKQIYLLEKTLALNPFGPKVYDVPLIPSTFYKIDPYTQLPAKIERKENTFDLITQPILLNPVDPKGLAGGPFLLGTNPGQNERHHENEDDNSTIPSSSRLSSEYQMRKISRSYAWGFPGGVTEYWSHIDPETGLTVAGNAQINDDTTWGYSNTEITRSAIIKRPDLEGDLTYGKTPVIENYSNALFFGNTVYGYEQSDIFPGPGPDFSYIKLEKAYVFNSDDDSFFVTEIKSEGEDVEFEKLMHATFPWATEFKLKLLDYEHENNLKTSYGVHWNRGYFSEIAKYVTSSAERSASGHYPGTGLKFSQSLDEDISDVLGNTAAVTGSPGAALRPHKQRRALASANPQSGSIGYYLLSGPNGGGDAASIKGGFKTAGMQMGLGELDYPKFQQSVASGNWDTGPGNSNFFGQDPIPGGIRYYNFHFEPFGRPLFGMNATNTNGPQEYTGRIIAGTFEINDQNPATDWWFQQGGKKEILWVSESAAGDVSQSAKIFMNDCYHKADDLHVITFNEAKHVDKTFTLSFQRTTDPNKKGRKGDVPGYPGDPSLNYTDATLGSPSNHSNYSYYQAYARPLNTFGSMLFSDPKFVGVKGAHQDIQGQATLGFYKYDFSAEAVAWSTANTGSTPLEEGDDGYEGIRKGTGPMGGIWGGGINAPRFLNGKPYIQTGDAQGGPALDDGNGSYTGGSYVNATTTFESVSVWTGYWYGMNWHTFPINNGVHIDYPERKGWPTLNQWTISKLEQKPNYILSDVNKLEELPEGEGDKGFILIPDTLNPRIKSNLDFYLAKAGLIGKEKAPRYKDKSIKKNTYLPVKRIRKRKRRGFFYKLIKRIKGKDY